jgi:adenylylsulfate kinase
VVGLAGVVETVDERARVEDAVGVPLTVVRLVASPDEVRRRLLGRYPDRDDAASLRWHLDRAGELDAVLDDGQVHDHLVPVDGLSPRQAARQVLDLLGARR